LDVRNDGRIGETDALPGEPARVRVSHRPKIFCCSPSLRMPAALARFLGRQPPAAQTPVQDNAAGNGSAAPLELNLLQTVIPTNFSIALNPEDFMQGHDSNLRKDQGVDTSTSAASSSSTGAPKGSTSSMSTSTTSVLLQRQNSVLQSLTKVKSTASSSGSANAALQTAVTPDALPDKSKALVAGGSAAKKGVSFSNVVSVREVESQNRGKKAPNRSDEPRARLAASSSDSADSQLRLHTVQPVERPPSERRASSPRAKPQVNTDTGETSDPVLRSALVKTKDSSSGSPSVGRDSLEVAGAQGSSSTALVLRSHVPQSPRGPSDPLLVNIDTGEVLPEATPSLNESYATLEERFDRFAGGASELASGASELASGVAELNESLDRVAATTKETIAIAEEMVDKLDQYLRSQGIDPDGDST
jgi:X-X-X-Leu-X-X-Gly heptad repeat protein